MNKDSNRDIHPLWLRINHWINALSVTLMIMSGWRIYNASPLFNFSFPNGMTIGGWLGGALQWHFAIMWMFGINGAIYLLVNIVSGRLHKRFWPLDISVLASELTNALKGRLKHNNIRHYNMTQKCAYLLVIADSILLVISGLVLWKPVQLSVITQVLGGYDNARVIHFSAMAFIFAFIIIHLIMVILVPKTFQMMIRGR